MTTASPSTSRTTSSAREPKPADVLVVFGITGDLAKVMTFRSLYRLEQRGLLDCPIVGVAVDDWTVDQLAERARESIVGTGEAARRGGVRALRRRGSPTSPGDFGDAATYERVARRSTGARAAGLLPRDPAVPVRHGRQGPRRGRADEERARRRREALRPRPRLRARAGRRAARVHRRVAALPDRPLPREDGPRGDPLPAVRQHDARAGLEPELRRVRADHDGGGLRRRGPRPLLRPGRRAARRGRQPPDAGRRRRPRWSRPPADDAHTLKDAQVSVFRAIARRRPGPLRARASTTATARSTESRRTRPPRPTPRCGSRSTTGAGQGVPFFIRTGKRLPVTQTELRLVFKHPPRLGFSAARRAGPSRTSSSSSSTRRPASGCSSRPSAATRRAPARSTSTWSSPRRAARARRPTRCSSTPRCWATARASPARTASRRPGGSCSRCSTRRHRSTRTRRGRGGRRRPTSSSPATAAGTDPGSTS